MAAKSWKRSIVLGFLVVVFGFVHSGYVVSILSSGAASVRWFVVDYPIEVQIWEGFTDQLPQVVDGSDACVLHGVDDATAIARSIPSTVSGVDQQGLPGRGDEQGCAPTFDVDQVDLEGLLALHRVYGEAQEKSQRERAENLRTGRWVAVRHFTFLPEYDQRRRRFA